MLSKAKPQRRARRRCKRCNNLDPRSHDATVHNDRGTAQLTLSIEVWDLKRVNDGRLECRFCGLIVRALEECWVGWKRKKGVLVEVGEGKAVRLRVMPVDGGVEGARDSVVIYVEQSGGCECLIFLFSFLFPTS